MNGKCQIISQEINHLLRNNYDYYQCVWQREKRIFRDTFYELFSYVFLQSFSLVLFFSLSLFFSIYFLFESSTLSYTGMDQRAWIIPRGSRRTVFLYLAAIQRFFVFSSISFMHRARRHVSPLSTVSTVISLVFTRPVMFYSRSSMMIYFSSILQARIFL